jgi:tetratricopeptide (TPR) repeat protein
MGFVVRAEENQLGREVALKFLHERHLRDPAAVTAFLSEAKISAQLQHPGVVPVHAAGVDADGRPFFSMRLVKGDTLADRLARRNHIAEDRIEFLSIFQKICDVLAYAHAEGVCHLDLKPANIVIGAYGEVMVMDWGLSLWAHSEATNSLADAPTLSRRIVGTPGYMAPEQATGQALKVGPRTDVFALGAVLTEILTGHPPYTGEVPEEVFLAASRGWLEDARGRLWSCGAEPELLRLAESCLAVHPSDRPASAASLSRGISIYLRSLEERARESAVEVAKSRLMAKNARRERRLAMALAGVVVTAALVGSGLWLALDGATERRTRSDVDHVLALASRADLLLERAQAHPGRSADVLQDALAEARSAYARTVSAALPDAYRNRLAQLVEMIEGAREEDRRIGVLLATLGSIHEHQSSGSDGGSRDRAYEAAFQKAGLNPFSAGAESAAQWLRENRTQNEIIRHMDDWLHARRSHRGVSEVEELVELINVVDSDSWRAQVRRFESERKIAELVLEAKRKETLDRSADSVLLLALSLRRLGAREEAKALFAQATMVHPGHYDLHHEYGILLRSGGSEGLPEAVRQFSMAVALRPTSAHAHLDLAQAMMQSDRMEEAMLSLDMAEKLDPLDASAHHYRGVMAYLKAEYAESVRHLNKALSLNPSYALSHGILGSIAAQEGDLDTAISHYTDAVAGRPFDNELRRVLAHTLARAADDGKAIAEFEHVLKAGSSQASDWYRYGLLMRLLDPTTARSAFRRAAELDGTFVSAWIQWGFQDFDALDMDGAMARFEKARSLLAGAAPPDGLPLDAAVQETTLIIHRRDRLRSKAGVEIGEELVDDRWAQAAAALGDFDRALHFLREAPSDWHAPRSAQISMLRLRARICFQGYVAAEEQGVPQKYALLKLGVGAARRALDLLHEVSLAASSLTEAPLLRDRTLCQLLLGLSRDRALESVWSAQDSGPNGASLAADLLELRARLEGLARAAGVAPR